MKFCESNPKAMIVYTVGKNILFFIFYLVMAGGSILVLMYIYVRSYSDGAVLTALVFGNFLGFVCGRYSILKSILMTVKKLKAYSREILA